MQRRWRSWSVVQVWTSCRVHVFPCTVCRTGVGSNSIFCNGCKHWVQKKCSGLKGLTKDPDYGCTQCQVTAHPLDGRPQWGPSRNWQAGGGSFILLPRRHALSCQWPHVKTTWKQFKEQLPVLSSRHLSFKTHGPVYSSCVQSAMLHASETWPLTKPNLQCLQ